MALAGKVPFVSSYAVFVPGRTWDQTRVGMLGAGSNVKIAGAHAGISVGPDGAIHQALEEYRDHARPAQHDGRVPGRRRVRSALHAVARRCRPVLFRFARKRRRRHDQRHFEIGKSYICLEGSDVTIAACGPLLHEALLAAQELIRDDIRAGSAHAATIRSTRHRS